MVDDSKLMLNVLRHLLEQAGHEVETWAEVTAEEVGERLSAANPDLVITDYHMPGCNGLMLVRRARMAKPDLPVVMLTSTHDPAILAALKGQAVSHILHKPLHEEELLEVVRKVLEA